MKKIFFLFLVLASTSGLKAEDGNSTYISEATMLSALEQNFYTPSNIFGKKLTTLNATYRTLAEQIINELLNSLGPSDLLTVTPSNSAPNKPTDGTTTGDVTEGKAQLKDAITQFAGLTGAVMPSFYGVIKRDFNNNVGAYVDALYEKSILAVPADKQSYESRLSLRHDLGVQLVLSLNQYRQALEVCNAVDRTFAPALSKLDTKNPFDRLGPAFMKAYMIIKTTAPCRYGYDFDLNDAVYRDLGQQEVEDALIRLILPAKDAAASSQLDKKTIIASLHDANGKLLPVFQAIINKFGSEERYVHYLMAQSIITDSGRREKFLSHPAYWMIADDPGVQYIVWKLRN